MFTALQALLNSLAVTFDLPILDWIQAHLQCTFLDVTMPIVTLFGDGGVFWIAVAVVLLLFAKYRKTGFSMGMALVLGLLVCNILLKPQVARIRPYNFQLQEYGREITLLVKGLNDYSFPSGHTQNAVAAYGGMFCITKKLWVRVVCMALALLIPFSRLYLGVHTPLDVGVSFLIGWLLVLAFYPLLEEIGHRGEVLEHIWLILLVPAALFLLYALRVRAGASGDAANFDHAVKTAWSMLGLVLGAIVSVFADRHYTRFETQAVWWAQILKVVLGLALTLAVRVALKAPLTAAFGANSVGDGIRYFAVVLMAGTLWPMTFGWFSLMGRKK